MKSLSVFRIVYGMALMGLCAFILSAGTVLDLRGKAVDPFHGSHARPVVLVFVRTDCPISNRYAPTVQGLAHKYSGKVDFWLVYSDRSESAASIQKQLTDYGYQIPALRDTGHDLLRASDVKVTPEAAVFSASDKLVYHGRIDNLYASLGRARAAATSHELEDAIDATLAGKTPVIASAPGIGCSVADFE